MPPVHKGMPKAGRSSMEARSYPCAKRLGAGPTGRNPPALGELRGVEGVTLTWAACFTTKRPASRWHRRSPFARRYMIFSSCSHARTRACSRSAAWPPAGSPWCRWRPRSYPRITAASQRPAGAARIPWHQPCARGHRLANSSAGALGLQPGQRSTSRAVNGR